MGVTIYSFNLNISAKMSYGVLECDVVISHAYDFVTKDLVIKKGCHLCQTLCLGMSQTQNRKQLLVVSSGVTIADTLPATR